MRVGIVASAYTMVYGLEKGAEMLARHGYAAVDHQGLIQTEREPLSLDERSFEKSLSNERRVFSENGIEVFQAHGPWRYPPMDLEENDRKERFDAFCKSVRGSAYLGSRYLVVHPIMPFGADSSENRDEFYAINLDFFGRLAEYAADYGVTVCLENMPFLKLPVSSPRSIADFVRTVNADNFKVCLDTGHANIFGMKLSKAVEDIGGDLLKTLHIHDNDGLRDMHLNPFCGNADWEDFGKALGKIGFEGVLSLETSAKEDTESAQKELVSSLLKIEGYTKKYI